LHKSFKKISFEDTFFFSVQLMYRSTWTKNYFLFFNCLFGGRRGRDHMVVGFTTTCAIGAYTNEVVILNPAQGEEYNIM
jgi:hypothetical protein